MKLQFLLQTSSAATQVLTNPELLGIIISHIEYDDINSLYSFSLVNKFWCKIGIPYLWKSPLSLNLLNITKIIPIYISCLDKLTKQKLSQLLKHDYNKRENILIESIYNNHIYNSQNNNHNNHNNHNHNFQLSRINENLRNIRNSFINLLRSNYLFTKPSTFNYLEFINEINLHSLYKLIFEWLSDLYSNATIINYIIDDTNSLINSINTNIQNINYNNNIINDQTLILTQQFFNFFINNSNHLQHLKFEDFYNSPLTLIQSFVSDNNNDQQKLQSQLSKLKSLDLQLININPDLISKFNSYNTHQLHTISLKSKYERVPPNFSLLIEKQEGLKILLLENVRIDIPTFVSINSQYLSLGNLSLINVIVNSSDALKKLSRCINLHTLRIEFNKEIPETYNNLSRLWNLQFPILNKLIIIGNISKNDLENYNFENDILKFFGINSKCYDYSTKTNSYSPRLLGEIQLPRLSELKGLRYLKHLDLEMKFTSVQISHLLDMWNKVPLIHLNYLCKDDVSDHHSILSKFSQSLNQQRLYKVDIKDSPYWYDNTTYRIDLDLYHCCI
ncbi:320_t:CDS:2 [Diversispora eburnea]|uniref:320_t:CDS:1 n=1 Tax=Diversispora eburnea TaxID=1213867 RepID=A0A9N9BBB5_9GLOM|nr:320_t:CDS:2 [Diversispora eburnea]